MKGGTEGRRYIEFDPDRGYPAGDDLYYECTRCRWVVSSVALANLGCPCKNVFIDIDYGRLCVRDHTLFRIFSSA
jgi:hypothetical protein